MSEQNHDIDAATQGATPARRRWRGLDLFLLSALIIVIGVLAASSYRQGKRWRKEEDARLTKLLEGRWASDYVSYLVFEPNGEFNESAAPNAMTGRRGNWRIQDNQLILGLSGGNGVPPGEAALTVVRLDEDILDLQDRHYAPMRYEREYIVLFREFRSSSLSRARNSDAFYPSFLLRISLDNRDRKKIIAMLADLLDTSEEDIRFQLTGALRGWFREEVELLAALERRLQDPSERVRAAARETLKERKTETPRE